MATESLLSSSGCRKYDLAGAAAAATQLQLETVHLLQLKASLQTDDVDFSVVPAAHELGCASGYFAAFHELER